MTTFTDPANLLAGDAVNTRLELIGTGFGTPEDTQAVISHLSTADPLCLKSSYPHRVIVAGDWHGDTGWASQVCQWAGAHEIPLIVQLGDFGLWPGPGGRHYLSRLNAAATANGLMIAFVDGNHDDHDQLAHYPILTTGLATGLRAVRSHIWHIPRGFRHQWAGRTYLTLGGAVSVDKVSSRRTQGLNWWAQEVISADQARNASDAGPAAVMFAHDTPSGFKLPELPPFCWGEPMLREAEAHRATLGMVVDQVQPELLLHGHYHVHHAARRPNPDGTTCDIVGLAQQRTRNNLVVFDPTDLSLQPVTSPYSP